MRRKYNYIFPIIIGAVLIAAMTAGYLMLERGKNLACGAFAPIGTGSLFAVEYIVEIMLVKRRKYGAAIAVSIIKYALFFFGLSYVFRNTLMGVSFFLLLALIPGCNFAFLSMALVFAPLLALCVVLVQAGIIVEPILLHLEKKKLYVAPAHIACNDL